MAMTGSTEFDEPTTARQRERRERILDATVALATKGGYDAVQMREVADRAEVALGTLYRYFPSKVHLLVSAMAREVGRLSGRMGRHIPADGDAYERVLTVLRRLTRALQREPELTGAMLRAVMAADSSAVHEHMQVRNGTTEMILLALREPDGSIHPEADGIATVIEQVWMSCLVSWLGGRASAAQVGEDLERATRLLLRPEMSRAAATAGA